MEFRCTWSLLMTGVGIVFPGVGGGGGIKNRGLRCEHIPNRGGGGVLDAVTTLKIGAGKT